MIYIVLNAIPIAVATFAAMALAALWYRRRPPVAALGTMIAAQAWLAAVLAGALILAPPKGRVWTMTIGSAVVIWAGFVLPSLTFAYRLRGQRWNVLLSDVGFWLAAMVLQAAAMRLIGLTPPPA